MDGSETAGRSSSRSPLRENIVALFILQMSNFLFAFISMVYLVRILGPANYGLIAFAQALTVYFTTVVDYGFNLSATRTIVHVRDDNEALFQFVSSVFVIKLAFALIGFMAVAVLCIYIEPFKTSPGLFMLSYVAVIGSVIFPVWLFQGLEIMRPLSWLSMAGRLISMLGMIIFVRHPEDLLWAAFWQSSAMLCSGLPGMIYLLRCARLQLRRPSLAEIRGTLKDGWEAFLATSSITLYTNTNVFVLGLIAAPAVVGYFSGASKLILALNGLFGPVNQAVYPHVTHLFKTSRRAGFRFMRKVIALQTAVSTVACSILFLTAGLAVRLVLGPDYGPSVLLLRIMVLLPVFSTLTNMIGVQIMMALNMKRSFLAAILFSGIVNLIIIVPLCSLYQAVGAAAAVMTVEVLTPLSMVLLLMRAGAGRAMLGLELAEELAKP